VENVNAELLVTLIVGSVTGIWGWLRSKQDSDIARAARDSLAKAILAEIRYEAKEQLSSHQIVQEFITRAREFTESEKLNKSLVNMRAADIIWNLEQIKVRDGDETLW
jgi:membrane-bound ClpP family serine protease